MDYAQVFTDHDALKEYLHVALGQRLPDLPADYVRSIPHADFGKAVFGHYLFPPESGLGTLSPASPEYRAALAAAMPSAPLVVWMKFGKELAEAPTVFGTLAELNAVAAAGPPLVCFRLNGVPAVVDYSGADAGVSRTYTVSVDGYRKTNRVLTAAALTMYRSLDWHLLVGATGAESTPHVSVPSIGVARPSP